MPRQTLSIYSAQVSTANSAIVTAVDGVSGSQFVNDGKRIALLWNTGANSITANFLTNTAPGGVVIPAQTAIVPSAILPTYFGPFLQGAFTQTDGNVYINYSGDVSTAKTTIMVLYVPYTAN